MPNPNGTANNGTPSDNAGINNPGINPDNGQDGGNGSDAGNGTGDGTGKSNPDNSSNDSYTRWKISQAKKEAAKEVINGANSVLPKGAKPEDLKNDVDFQSLIDEMVQDKLKGYGLDKINKIDEFETRFQKDEFFNQFKEAGKTYAEYGLSIEPSKGGEILADIEANGFTPAQLILLANADIIMGKLKGLPRSPMSTDDGSRVKNDTTGMTMQDRLGMIKSRLLGQ